jgi:hypothetical protein
MVTPRGFTLALSSLVAFASAAKETGPFSLFAYGPGIGGLPLFSTGGMFSLKEQAVKM